jgi:hypothetical protein
MDTPKRVNIEIWPILKPIAHLNVILQNNFQRENLEIKLKFLKIWLTYLLLPIHN